jgi:hypothetical protein
LGKGSGGGYAVVQEVRVSEEQSEREWEKSPSILHQWDATSLTTCAKFQLEGRLIAVVQELVEAGYAETVRQLHVRYQRGELSFRAVADELGLSVRELYDLFEKKGLPT